MYKTKLLQNTNVIKIPQYNIYYNSFPSPSPLLRKETLYLAEAKLQMNLKGQGVTNFANTKFF